MTDLRLSPHFMLSEFVESDYALRHGLDNTPPGYIVEKLKLVAAGLERVRNELLGCRIIISSGYRSPEVNRGIGGSEKSQHMRGEAADFKAPAYGGAREVSQFIANHIDLIDCDQIIFEGSWTHISFTEREPRHSVLTAHFGNGGVHYTEGIC